MQNRGFFRNALKIGLLFQALVVTITYIGCTKDSDSGPSTNACGVLGLDSSRIGHNRTVTGRTVNGRIVNGTECTPGLSPIVRLDIRTRNNRTGKIEDFLCTGSMVTSSSVLSAAHCFQIDNHTILATLITGGPVGQGEQKTTARSFTVHPNYGVISGEFQNDVSVVTLRTSLALPTLPIFASRPTEVGDIFSIYGFGVKQTSGADTGLGILRSGQMEVDSFTAFNVQARFDGSGSDTCEGDSGGPAVLRATRDDGESITGIIAITSSGIKENCTRGDIASFTNVQITSVLDFIRDTAPGVAIE